MAPGWIIAPALVPRGDRPGHDHGWALGITALYVIAALIHGLLSQAPWDDDCIVRYFHCREAWQRPEYFFSVWDRPLFVALFAPTAVLGRTVMMVQMVAIGAFSGWSLYRALQLLGWKDAYRVLPFFYFQTYYFSLSRNFVTEPLGVGVICLGLLALVRERYGLFALLGGLLPLARLELALILPLWALVLVMQRRWRAMVWLVLPTLVLLVLGYLVRRPFDPFWLLTDTFGNVGENRYGHRDPWHYFQRSAYVVGPVVFLFLVIGLVERVARRRIDLFILLQGAAILLVYVVFSWKLDLGNAAGFLRNLIPLTPLIAVVAYEGCMVWMSTLDDTDGSTAEPTTTAGSLAHLRPHLAGLGAVVLLWHYFGTTIADHHRITDTPDHGPAYVALAATLVGLVLFIRRQRRKPARWASAAAATLVAALAVGFTLHTERPDAHLNDERRAIAEVSDLYRTSPLRAMPLLCNHPWFFWTLDLRPEQEPHTRPLTLATVDRAPIHAVLLWENHYGNRLRGDVPLDALYARRDLVEVMHVIGRDHRTTVGLFQKVDPTAQDHAALIARNRATYPGNVYVLLAEHLHRMRLGDHPGALSTAQDMVKADSTYAEAWVALGGAYTAIGRHREAIAAYQRAYDLAPTLVGMHYHIGLARYKLHDFTGAIASLKAYIARERRVKEAYEVLGSAYFDLMRFDASAAMFSNVIELAPTSPSGWLGRGNAHLRAGRVAMALGDYDQVLRLVPDHRTAKFYKAMALIQLGRKGEGCTILNDMAQADDPAIAQAIATWCP